MGAINKEIFVDWVSKGGFIGKILAQWELPWCPPDVGGKIGQKVTAQVNGSDEKSTSYGSVGYTRCTGIEHRNQ
jgi:hypothetical protein